MADPMRSPAALWLLEQGWEVVITRANHLRATHPHAPRPLFTGCTPGDKKRPLKHVKTQAARLLREGPRAR
jgi:hypothetical protein